MGKCLKCGEVYGPFELKEGLCPGCYDPKEAKKLNLDVDARVAIHEKRSVKLQKDGEIVEVSRKFDWATYIYGVLFGPFGVISVLRYKDLRLFGFTLFVTLFYLAAMLALIAFDLDKKSFDNLPYTLILTVAFWTFFATNISKWRIKYFLKRGYEPATSFDAKIVEKLGLINGKSILERIPFLRRFKGQKR
jgi:hypothetical protein